MVPCRTFAGQPYQILRDDSCLELPQGKALTVWGWAQPGEAVTVQFLAESKQAIHAAGAALD